MAKMENGLVMRAAAFLMVVQLLSRLLGWIKDVVMINVFGMDFATDAFNAAFSIPDFFFNILVGGALSSAFIPVFSSYLAQKKEKQAWHTCSAFTTWALLLMLVCLIFAAIFTEPFLHLLTKFTPDQMALPVALTRITLVQAIFMSLSGISQGILNSNQHFTWPALGTLCYNVLIIICGVLLVKPIEAIAPGYGIAAFSIGVVVGAILMLVIQIPQLRRIGYNYHFTLDVHDPGLRQMVKLMIPVLVGLSVAQINLFVTQYLATGLEDGVYTALRTANRFMQLPLGVFSASICTAMFPTMTAQAATSDFTELKRSLSLGMRTIIYIILPSSVGLIMLRQPIIRLMYEFSGEFTQADSLVCAEALLFYCIGLIGYSLVSALLRCFYALKNTVTPLVVSAVSIVISIIFSVILVGPMEHRGLALAYSLAGLAQCAILFIILRRRLGQMDGRRLLITLIKTGIACVVMAIVVWLVALGMENMIGTANKLTQLLQVLVSVGLGVISFFIITWRLKMEEFTIILDIFRRFLHRRKAIPKEKI